MSELDSSEEFFNIITEKTLKNGVSSDLVDDYFYYKLLNTPLIDSTSTVHEFIEDNELESLNKHIDQVEYIYDYTNDSCLNTKIADTTEDAEDYDYFINNDEIINRLHRLDTDETIDLTRDPSRTLLSQRPYSRSLLSQKNSLGRSGSALTATATTDTYIEDSQPIEYTSDYLTYLSTNAETAFIDMCQLSKTLEEDTTNTDMANWALPKAYNHHSEMVNALSTWYSTSGTKKYSS